MEKKTKVKLLAIQLGSVIADLDANIKKAEKLLEYELIRNAADFVFLPEVWSCGWDCSSFEKCSEDINNSDSIKMLQKIAKKYNVNIIGGSIILKGMTNSCPVINRNGELVCTYDKNHLFSYHRTHNSFDKDVRRRVRNVFWYVDVIT